MTDAMNNILDWEMCNLWRIVIANDSSHGDAVEEYLDEFGFYIDAEAEDEEVLDWISSINTNMCEDIKDKIIFVYKRSAQLSLYGINVNIYDDEVSYMFKDGKWYRTKVNITVNAEDKEEE